MPLCRGRGPAQPSPCSPRQPWATQKVPNRWPFWGPGRGPSRLGRRADCAAGLGAAVVVLLCSGRRRGPGPAPRCCVPCVGFLRGAAWRFAACRPWLPSPPGVWFLLPSGRGLAGGSPACRPPARSSSAGLCLAFVARGGFPAAAGLGSCPLRRALLGRVERGPPRLRGLVYNAQHQTAKTRCVTAYELRPIFSRTAAAKAMSRLEPLRSPICPHRRENETKRHYYFV